MSCYVVYWCTMLCVVNVQAVDTLELHSADFPAATAADSIIHHADSSDSDDSDSDRGRRLRLAVHTVDELVGDDIELPTAAARPTHGSRLGWRSLEDRSMSGHRSVEASDDELPAASVPVATVTALPRSILSITPRSSLAATSPKPSGSRVRLYLSSSRSPSPRSRSRSASPVLTARRSRGSLTSVCDESLIHTTDSDIIRSKTGRRSSDPAHETTDRSGSGRRSSKGQRSARRVSEMTTYSEDFTSAATSRRSSFASSRRHSSVAGVSASSSRRRNSSLVGKSGRKSSVGRSVEYSSGSSSSEKLDSSTLSSAVSEVRHRQRRRSSSLRKHR